MTGPKQVTCSICGETVFKARTAHVGNGERACKEHEGVVDKANQVQIQQQETLRKSRKPKTKPDRTRDFKKELVCMTCGQESVKVSDILSEVLVISKKMEMGGEPINLLLNPAKVINEARKSFGEKKPMYVFTKDELTADQWQRVKKNAGHLREVLDLFGVIGVCVECCTKLDLPDKLQQIEQPSLETLSLMGAMMEEPFRQEVERRAEAEAEAEAD